MDTSRFVDRDSGFGVLGLSARASFRSPGSISFDLGRYSDILRLPGGFGGDLVLNVGRSGVSHVVGRVDVHHPCDGHIKAQLLAVLPGDYHAVEPMEEFVAAEFRALGIPPDETFELLFIGPDQQTRCENTIDRDGITYQT